jgi:hypothetical protein
VAFEMDPEKVEFQKEEIKRRQIHVDRRLQIEIWWE